MDTIQDKIFPSLYFKDSHNNTRFWRIRTESNKIITEWGVMCKPSELKPQQSVKIVTGKNKGKINETIDEEQAILDAESKWKQKKKKGYNELNPNFHTKMPERKGTRAQINEYIEEAIYPMLAKKYNESKRHIKYPIDVQSKLDGMRCVVFMKNNKPQLCTRGRKDIPFMTHLHNEIIQIFNIIGSNCYLDGELFCKGKSLQHIISRVRRSKNRHDWFNDIQYHIFDIYDSDLLSEKRLEILDNLNKNTCKYIKIVPTIVINSEEELFKQHEEFKNQGYEGTIIRLRGFPYRQGKNNYHCKQLIKLKSHFDDEGIVIDAREATGNQKGCIIFKLQWNEVNFWITPKMTLDERIELWNQWVENPKLIKGRKMTFRYYDLTDDGIPKFANVTGFRDDDL